MHLGKLAGTLGIAACMAAPALSAELIYSSHTPDTYADNAFTAKRFFDRVTKATDGEHTVRIVGGGALAKGGAALEAVKSGAVDTTILVYNYTPSDIPVLGLMGDLYSTDEKVAGPATSETMLLDCPECLEEMKRQNIVVLFNTSSPPYNLLCTKSRVESLADAKGLKIRAVGSFGPLAAHLGATPVNITYGEIYEALQRGQIDCAMNDASQVGALKLDFLKYVTAVPLGTFQSIGFVVVNRDVWNGFSDAQKRAWIDSAAVGLVDFERNFIERVQKATEDAKTASGLEVVTPGADLMKAVSDYRAAETPSLLERARKRGVKDPEAIAAAFAKNTAKWTKIVADIGPGEWTEEQWGQYLDAVRKEIFDKVKL